MKFHCLHIRIYFKKVELMFRKDWTVKTKEVWISLLSHAMSEEQGERTIAESSEENRDGSRRVRSWSRVLKQLSWWLRGENG